MRKAKETWTEEQCQGIEENLQKNNSKKAYQPVKELTSSKQGRTTTIQDKAGNVSQKNKTFWRGGQSTALNCIHAHNNRRSQGARCPSTNQQWQLPCPAGRSWSGSKITEEGKSAGVDNIPSELIQGGGEAMIDMLLIICNKIWQTGEWPTPWTQSLIITLPKKGNLQLFQNYRTMSLISHPSKVMLRILLNRLKPQAEEIIKEQAGFRAGRSTTEQIFNLRILCEKYLQHQQSSLPCLRGLQERVRQSLACSFADNHEAV